jgi:hypothetical protein
MALDSAETYLVFCIQGKRFAVSLGLVAGVTVLSDEMIARFRGLGVLEWQGFYCPPFELQGPRQNAQAGDTALILELMDGRKALICEPKTYFRKVETRLAVPRSLVRRNPAVRDVFWDGSHLVHCLEFAAPVAA